jgi:hypothetical protein
MSRIGLVGYSMGGITTVRVLKDGMPVLPSVYWALMHGRRCERFKVFRQFSLSRFFAKLSGCIPENLSSPNSLI